MMQVWFAGLREEGTGSVPHLLALWMRGRGFGAIAKVNFQAKGVLYVRT